MVPQLALAVEPGRGGKPKPYRLAARLGSLSFFRAGFLGR
jgi:hypothetical protein